MNPVPVCIAEEEQRLLFDRAANAKLETVAVPADFYKRGFVIVQNLATEAVADRFLANFVGSFDASRAPLIASMLSRLRLAKKDAIPVCKDIVNTGFQALHYDMGQPFIASQPQAMYAISALYRPADSAPNPDAQTRLVYLPDLLQNHGFGSRQEVKDRLLDYVRAHGDGWTHPKPHNTHRLAIFARILDAMSDKPTLAEKIDTMIGQCFEYDADPDGLNGLRQERAFFARFGLNLSDVEQRIVLAPGEMLIFDNIRCVHGRIGRRRQRELINYLYGVKEASEEDINNYTNWLYELLAD